MQASQGLDRRLDMAAAGWLRAARTAAADPARKRRRSIAVERIEPHGKADRRGQLLPHEIAHMLLLGGIVMLVNLLVDVAYGVINPRIRR